MHRERLTGVAARECRIGFAERKVMECFGASIRLDARELDVLSGKLKRYFPAGALSLLKVSVKLLHAQRLAILPSTM
jgi:hypothetical protein